MIEGRLRELLLQCLSPVDLSIRDDSAAHAGHAGAREGAHFAVAIVTSQDEALDALRQWGEGIT